MSSRLIQLETHVTPSVPFFLGEDVEDLLPETLRGHRFDRCFLITSGPLQERFGRPLAQRLRNEGLACDEVVIREGEAGKSWDTLSHLCERLVDLGATKDSVLLGVGGGVIGNIVGLAAGLIYRGLRFVEIPTTLMAQSDGSLSNKQAINGHRGKNQFGLYHAPLFVWADCGYSRQEPIRQLRAALAEAVKNALITSRWRVEQCTRKLDLEADQLAGERFLDLVRWAVESKFVILDRDPSERSAAVALEYGHTFGHAIEWLSAPRLLHGEAVAIGMCLAAELSAELGLCDRSLVSTHFHLLRDLLQLPTSLPADLSAEQVYEAMHFDNKRNRSGLQFLLLRDFGDLAGDDDMVLTVDREVVLRVLERSRQRTELAIADGLGERLA